MKKNLEVANKKADVLKKKAVAALKKEQADEAN